MKYDVPFAWEASKTEPHAARDCRQLFGLARALARVGPDSGQRRLHQFATSAIAVQHFGKPIREGTLTVIGTVYGLEGKLDGGPGKLHIANVNGNPEPERMQALAVAIGKAPAMADSATAGDTHEQRVLEALRKTRASKVHVAVAEH